MNYLTHAAFEQFGAAATYGCGAYGSDEYQDKSCAAGVPNTGYAPRESPPISGAALGFMLLGTLLLLAAVVAFIRTRR